MRPITDGSAASVTDPNRALEICQKIGFSEEEKIRDVRAGDCELVVLWPTCVLIKAQNGQRIPVGTAVDLYDSYQSGDFQSVEGEP